MSSSVSPSQATPNAALVDADARAAIRTALDDTFAVEAAAGTGLSLIHISEPTRPY